MKRIDRSVVTAPGPHRIATINPRSASWLVSVRSTEELLQAVGAGVDIIDLKEPGRGALSPVDVGCWHKVAALASRSDLPPLSAALGERDEASAIAPLLPACFAFAKAGPSGCGSAAQIRQLWNDVANRLDPSIELVAVGYADATAAQCIDVQSVLREARQAGLKRCLIDTYQKDGKSSLQHLGIDQLTALDALARELDIWWALAGSITSKDVETLADVQIHPNCYAVRGDVCDTGRAGALCERRLRAWGQLFAR